MTGRIIPIDPNGHGEVRLLLPWYVTGSLGDSERAAVEAHLEQCPECRAAAASERDLATEMRALPLDLGLDAEHGWAALRQRLEVEEASARPARRSLLGWLRRADALGRGWRTAEPWMRWAVVAQACLVLGLSAAMLWREASPRYHVLGEAKEPPEANLMVIFKPDTPEHAFREMITASGARLVDGPTAANAYLLMTPAKDRSMSLTLLRARQEVVLAEPIDRGDSR